jgi:2-polyprenyl-6-methoxyphenol hydroxylase-like FAD-dependent oxidoreductase
MNSILGKQAIVVGAGMGGLTAAGVLADYFERVIVLERDTITTDAAHRRGTPQARHAHALLAGGQLALESLFPGCSAALEGAGAVPMRVAVDVRYETPGYDPFPQRDLGWNLYSMSRPLAEFVVRQRLRKRANVELREHSRVEAIVAQGAGSTAKVSGVQLAARRGESEILPAELVVDASSRGALTLAVLQSANCPIPAESRIGVDVAYATTVFSIPHDHPSGWKSVLTHPIAPDSSRCAFMMPIEGDRWMLTLAGMHGDASPGDFDGFMKFAAQLRTTTIHRAIEGATPVSDVARFALPESIRRHFEQLGSFPRGLIPIGDAICRFNPIYGQGMSVAAQEACVLRNILAAHAGVGDPLDGLARTYFSAIQDTIDTPWATAAVADFVYPMTRGERPVDIESALRFGLGLSRLAGRDAEVHRLMLEVRHLLKPRSVYRDPTLVERVRGVMAEA